MTVEQRLSAQSEHLVGSARSMCASSPKMILAFDAAADNILKAVATKVAAMKYPDRQ